jgi:16S rRNA C1402 N4-methylase RsmH
VKTFLNDRSKEAPGSRHAPAQAGPAATFSLVNRKPLSASEVEVEANRSFISRQGEVEMNQEISPTSWWR